MKNLFRGPTIWCKFLLVMTLALVIVLATGCVGMCGEAFDMTYNEYATSPSCIKTGAPTTVSESYEWWEGLDYYQERTGFLLMMLFYSPTFTGHMHLPITGPYNPNEELPFTAHISGTTLRFDIDHTDGNVEYQGQIHCRTRLMVLPPPLTSFGVADWWLDPNKTSWINKLENGVCTKRVEFTHLDGDGCAAGSGSTLIGQSAEAPDIPMAD